MNKHEISDFFLITFSCLFVECSCLRGIPVRNNFIGMELVFAYCIKDVVN